MLKKRFPTNIKQSAPIYKPAFPNGSLQEALSTAANTCVPVHSLKNKQSTYIWRTDKETSNYRKCPSQERKKRKKKKKQKHFLNS